MSKKGTIEVFQNKITRNDRFAQMSHQEKVIEQKKREIQAKFEQKSKTVTPPVEVKPAATINTIAKAPKSPPVKQTPENSFSFNTFSNDGSFLDQFKQLKEKKPESKSKLFKNNRDQDRKYMDDRHNNKNSRWSQRRDQTSKDLVTKSRTSRFSERSSGNFEPKISISTTYSNLMSQPNFDGHSIPPPQTVMTQSIMKSINVTTPPPMVFNNIVTTIPNTTPLTTSGCVNVSVIAAPPILLNVPPPPPPIVHSHHTHTHQLLPNLPEMTLTVPPPPPVSAVSSPVVGLMTGNTVVDGAGGGGGLASMVLGVPPPSMELAAIPPPNPMQIHSIPPPEPMNTLTIPPPAPLQVQNIPPPSPIQLNEIPNPKPLDLLAIPSPNPATLTDPTTATTTDFIKNIPPPNKSVPPPCQPPSSTTPQQQQLTALLNMSQPPPVSSATTTTTIVVQSPGITLPNLVLVPPPPPVMTSSVTGQCLDSGVLIHNPVSTVVQLQLTQPTLSSSPNLCPASSSSSTPTTTLAIVSMQSNMATGGGGLSCLTTGGSITTIPVSSGGLPCLTTIANTTSFGAMPLSSGITSLSGGGLNVSLAGGGLGVSPGGAGGIQIGNGGLGPILTNNLISPPTTNSLTGAIIPSLMAHPILPPPGMGIVPPPPPQHLNMNCPPPQVVMQQQQQQQHQQPGSFVQMQAPPPQMNVLPPPPVILTEMPGISQPPPPFPNMNTVFTAGSAEYEALASLARMVAECGPGIEEVLLQRKPQDPSLWFLHNRDSAVYRQYQRLVCELNNTTDGAKRRRSTIDDNNRDNNNREESMMAVDNSGYYNPSDAEVNTSGNSETYRPEDIYEPIAASVGGGSEDDEHVSLDAVKATTSSGEDEEQRRRARKRKSRWGGKTQPQEMPPVGVAVIGGVKSEPGGGVEVKFESFPPGKGPVMLSKVTRTDPALIQYATNAFGIPATQLNEEEWNRAEEHYKISLLYRDMLRKRERVERLQRSGRNNYEYDSDEEVDDGGTWEHKLREKEMIATDLWATELTRAASGKHHIGDFLPPDEFRKFLEQSQAVQGGRSGGGGAGGTGGIAPDNSDYREFKLREDNVGFRMLQRLGWSEGKGLGADGAGIVDPVNKGTTRESNQGLGLEQGNLVTSTDDEYDAYRKRMMLAYRFRPNPLNNPRRPYY